MMYFVAFMLFGVGIYGIVSQRSLFKQLVSLSIIDTAVNIFIVSIGYVKNAKAPIYSEFVRDSSSLFVDPLPQALVLTAIVIGVGVLALGIALLIKIYKKRKGVESDSFDA